MDEKLTRELILQSLANAECEPSEAELEKTARTLGETVSGVESEVHRRREENSLFEQLAELPPLQYDRVRKATADSLCCSVATLDKEVSHRRGPTVSDDDEAVVEHLEPWPDSVNGTDLAEKLLSTMHRHVSMPEHAKIALVTWVMAAYVINWFRVFPKVLLTSPQKRCGKSTTLEVIESMLPRALLTAGSSPAALFRSIELWQPSLLLDEVDRWPQDADGIVQVVNCGHTRRTAFVLRTTGDDHLPHRFACWCPMVLAGIGKPDGTIVDRSIVIEMRRKLPGENLERLPPDLYESMAEIRRMLTRWALDAGPTIQSADPIHLPISNDRAVDNCSTLMAVAAVIGPEWCNRTRTALLELHGEDIADEEEDASLMLLADIREFFDRKGNRRVFSEDLVKHLVSLEGRPWSEWRRGLPISQNGLARLLKPYRKANGAALRASNQRLGDRQAKGYRAEDFADAFERYLPPPQSPSSSAGIPPIDPSHRPTPANTGAVADSQPVPAVIPGHFENDPKPRRHAAWDTGTDETGYSPARESTGGDDHDFEMF